MYARVGAEEKPYVLNAWANAVISKGADDANHRALRLYQEAIRLKPDYLVARYNIMQTLSNLGNEEGVVAVAEALLKAAGGRPGRGDENLYQYWDVVVWNLQALRAGFISDMGSHGIPVAPARPVNMWQRRTDAARSGSNASIVVMSKTPMWLAQ
jgi:hypothetical protein